MKKESPKAARPGTSVKGLRVTAFHKHLDMAKNYMDRVNEHLLGAMRKVVVKHDVHRIRAVSEVLAAASANRNRLVEVIEDRKMTSAVPSDVMNAAGVLGNFAHAWRSGDFEAWTQEEFIAELVRSADFTARTIQWVRTQHSSAVQLLSTGMNCLEHYHTQKLLQ